MNIIQLNDNKVKTKGNNPFSNLPRKFIFVFIKIKIIAKT